MPIAYYRVLKVAPLTKWTLYSVASNKRFFPQIIDTSVTSFTRFWSELKTIRLCSDFPLLNNNGTLQYRSAASIVNIHYYWLDSSTVYMIAAQYQDIHEIAMCENKGSKENPKQIIFENRVFLQALLQLSCIFKRMEGTLLFLQPCVFWDIATKLHVFWHKKRGG